MSELFFGLSVNFDSFFVSYLCQVLGAFIMNNRVVTIILLLVKCLTILI